MVPSVVGSNPIFHPKENRELERIFTLGCYLFQLFCVNRGLCTAKADGAGLEWVRGSKAAQRIER